MDAPTGRGNPQLLLSQPAHALSWQDVVQELGSHHEDGLEHAEAAERLASVGANELDDDTGVDIVAILVSQVANAMTLVSRDIICFDDFVNTLTTTGPYPRHERQLWHRGVHRGRRGRARDCAQHCRRHVAGHVWAASRGEPEDAERADGERGALRRRGRCAVTRARAGGRD